jgi:hemerythrin-like domain-containing protein
MNAISVLAAEHEAMALLVRDLESDSSDAMQQRHVMRRLATLIETHTMIEEELFYPVFRSARAEPNDDIMYFEAIEEHRALTELILPDLLRAAPGSTVLLGRLKALREHLEHHFAEEEEELFPRVQALLGDAALLELGAQLIRRRREIERAG